MDEMITRQIAIEALKICDTNEDVKICHICPMRDERWDGAWEDNETICYKKLMRDSAKLLARPGWIPCSRELPKKDGDYLVTNHSGQIARYIFIGGSSEEYWRRCATAWMPLPTPYREGGQDEAEQ